MTETHNEAQTEAAVIADLATQAAITEKLEPGRLYKFRDGDGGEHILSTDQYAGRPARKESVISVTDAESFTAYLDKHGLAEETEITALSSQSKFLAVINAGTPDEAGWGDHTVTLALRPSEEWGAWTSRSGKLMNQADFAEFIEDNAENIVEPSSAEVLEIAQSLQIKRGVEFEQGQRLADGNVQFGYRETTTATAGTVGQLTIPATLTLGLRPFADGEAYKVTAHFRYRLQGNQLALGFKVQDATKVREDAFKAIAGGIREHAEQNDYLYLVNS